ncbi:MAG: CHAD domain-containing protein [Gemmatimonadetes bacterium]|nr:CHAD domain-containing protein [Gemmatimonadota bacterium]
MTARRLQRSARVAVARRNARAEAREGQGVTSAPFDAGALLIEPTPRAARAVAIALIDAIDAEYPRLGAKGDTEALHDFRVAMRRLRSWMRAYHRELSDSVGSKTLRRLAELARVTTDSRDIEVHLEWITAQGGTLQPAERPGARWLAKRLRAEKTRADAALRSVLAEEFTEVSARLRKNLARYAVAVWDQEPADRWAATAAGQVQEAFTVLRRCLAAIEDLDSDEQAHRARIAGKRLRYLLEPLAGPVEGVPECIELLKRLQDLLGSMHDAYVFTRVVRRHARTQPKSKGGVTSRNPQKGLRALSRRLKTRRNEAWTEFTTAWMERDFAALADAVHDVIRQLQDIGGAGVEIERKYLLRKLPPEAKAAPVAEIEQGYLPGSVLIERVRRVKTADGVRYVRTVKTGSGLVRTEVEEECSYAVFKALWPLTKGKRVRKFRYRLADAGQVWEIDEFRDQRLVLAEIELRSARDDVPVPDWLARCLVREVTDEPEYVNAVLAR